MSGINEVLVCTCLPVLQAKKWLISGCANNFRFATSFSSRRDLAWRVLRFSFASFPAEGHCVRDKCSPKKRFCFFTSVREGSVLGINTYPVLRVIKILLQPNSRRVQPTRRLPDVLLTRVRIQMTGVGPVIVLSDEQWEQDSGTGAVCWGAESDAQRTEDSFFYDDDESSPCNE